MHSEKGIICALTFEEVTSMLNTMLGGREQAGSKLEQAGVRGASWSKGSKLGVRGASWSELGASWSKGSELGVRGASLSLSELVGTLKLALTCSGDTKMYTLISIGSYLWSVLWEWGKQLGSEGREPCYKRGGGHSKTCLHRRWGPHQILVDLHNPLLLVTPLGVRGPSWEWGGQPLVQKRWWAPESLQVVRTPQHTPRCPLPTTSAQHLPKWKIFYVIVACLYVLAFQGQTPSQSEIFSVIVASSYVLAFQGQTPSQSEIFSVIVASSYVLAFQDQTPSQSEIFSVIVACSYVLAFQDQTPSQIEIFLVAR